MTLPELRRELGQFSAQSNPPVIRLRADANSTAQQYITVMDELKKSNLTKISFDTQIQKD